MNTDRSAHLRQSYDCRFQLARIGLHNVSQLVYYDYYVRHCCGGFFFSFIGKGRLGGVVFADRFSASQYIFMIRLNVSHFFRFKYVVASIHLFCRPF